MRIKSLLLVVLSVALFFGCKKDEFSDSIIQTETYPVSGVVHSDYDVDGLRVMSMYGEDEIENGTFTVDIAESDLPQMLFITNDTGGVVMMYRGLMSSKSGIVVDVESTVIGLITMDPMTMGLYGSDFSTLADRIKSSRSYQALYNAVERSIKLGADIFSPTDGALVNAITDMQEELFGTFDDIWELIQLNQFNEFLGQNCGKLDVRAEGTNVLVRNLKCAPTYYGTLRSPSNNVKEINFPTASRSPLEDAMNNIASDIFNHGWDDYGPTKSYNLNEVGLYTFDVSWDNEDGKSDVATQIFRDFLNGFVDAAKIVELPIDIIEDAIDDTKDMMTKLLEISNNSDQMSTLENFWNVFKPEWTVWFDKELTFVEKLDKRINGKTLELVRKYWKSYAFAEDGFNIAMRVYYLGMCPKHLFFQAYRTEDGSIIPFDPDPIPDFIPSKIETLEEFRHVVEELCDGAPYSPTTGSNWLRNTVVDTGIVNQYYDLSWTSRFVLAENNVRFNTLSLYDWRSFVALHMDRIYEICNCEHQSPPSQLPNIPDSVRRIPVRVDKNLTNGNSHSNYKSCFIVENCGYVVVEAFYFDGVFDSIITNDEIVAKTILATFIHDSKTWVVFSNSSSVVINEALNVYVKRIGRAKYFCKKAT